MIYTHVEGVGGDGDNGQFGCFLVGQRDLFTKPACDVFAFDLQVGQVILIIFYVSYFVEAAEDKHSALQQIQSAEQPSQVILVAFLDGVGRVHHIEHQVRFAHVLFGDVLVLLDGVSFGIFLFLEAEQPGGVDQHEVFIDFIDFHLIGGFLMADLHAGPVQLFHPGRRNRSLAFREAANQRDLEFLTRHAADDILQLAAQCRVNRYAGLRALTEEILQPVQQRQRISLLGLERLESVFHYRFPASSIWRERVFRRMVERDSVLT
ncbi:hypothetical protein D3C85_974420 [compost metagenome]